MVCGVGPISMIPLGYEFCTSKDSKEDKVNKFEEKVKNKTKHGVATAGVAGFSIAGAAMVLGHEDKKAIKDGAKIASQRVTSVLELTPQKTAEFIEKVKSGDFSGIKIANNEFKEKATEFLKKAPEFKKELVDKVKNADFTKFETITKEAKEALSNTAKKSKGVFEKTVEGSSKLYNIVKNSLTFGSKKLGAMFDTVANSLKTLPKNQKIAIGILAAGLTAIGLINNHSSYRNGKIDQKYDKNVEV